MKYDYLVVGAGLFGAVFAREATDRGKTCLVIDRREHLGGTVYTKEIEGIHVHVYGAHIFHTNSDEVWDYVNRFVAFNEYVHRPVADYKGERYPLPFTMNTFRALWGVTTAEEAKAKIAEQIADAKIGEPKNLEEQALKLVGRDVFEKLVKGYTEKQWGRRCDLLPAFIIKRLPLRFTYDDNYFDAKYQGIPIGGYTGMVRRMLKGVDVLTGVEYAEFIRNTADEFGKTVYTGGIDEYYGYALGKLEYRTVRFETEVLDTEDYQGNAVVNYTAYEVPYTRIIEHKHFEGTKCPKTVISREYPAEYKEGMEAYYPINDEKNGELYARYAEMAKKEKNVVFGGRLGEYKYYDMDRVIESALALAEKELQ